MQVFKPSWVVLTFNRKETVLSTMFHNRREAGGTPYELIHVDNGSHDGVENSFREYYNPDVSIYNSTNLGVAKGYNRGTVLATGTHLVITGCDRKMPVGWLHMLEVCFSVIPNTGVVSIYSQPINKVNERRRGEEKEINGIKIIPAMPMEAKCYRMDLLRKAGHLREDFGLYGWEDVEHGFRVEKVAKEMGLLTYILPDMVAEHMGSEGVSSWNGIDNFDYHQFKQKQSEDPEKAKLMEWCGKNDYPYYNPYL